MKARRLSPLTGSAKTDEAPNDCGAEPSGTTPQSPHASDVPYASNNSNHATKPHGPNRPRHGCRAKPTQGPPATTGLTIEALQQIIDAGHAAAQCDDSEAAPAQRAVELLARLVATPSPSTHEAAASRLLAAWMRDAGLNGRVDEVGNAVGGFETTHGTHRPVHILLLGHIDTVPGDIPLRIEHRTLHGRGAVDAKGSLAAFACAASRLAQQPHLLPAAFRLTLVGAVEEECSTSRGARHMAELFKDQPPHACIIGEPSGVDGVTLGYKGRLLVRATFKKACAHSAGPDCTAAELAADFWQSCRAIADRHDSRLVESSGPFYRLQSVLRSLNSSDDGLHQTAECVVGFRLPIGGPPPNELETRVQTLAADLPFNSAGTTLRLEFEAHETAHQSPRDDAIARHLSAAIRKRFGRPARMKLKTGTSDMNVVAPVFACPIVAYGPGDSSLDHTPIEHIDLDQEYLPAIDVLVEAIRTLAWELAGGTGT